jgi:hypothetical protein
MITEIEIEAEVRKIEERKEIETRFQHRGLKFKTGKGLVSPIMTS